VRHDEGDPTSPTLPLQQGALDEEPEPIHHLRAYSRYLTPWTGPFSGDTWTLGAIYLRNLLINFAVLLPWALGIVLLSRLLLWAFTLNRDLLGGRALPWGLGAVFTGAAAGLGVWLYRQRTRLHEAAEDPTAHPAGADRVGPAVGVALLAGVLLLVVSGLWLFSYSPPPGDPVQRLSAEQAEGLSLPLRHPGYSWLNERSPIAHFPGWLKFVTLAGGGITLLSALAWALRLGRRHEVHQAPRAFRRARRQARAWVLLLSDLCLSVGIGAFLWLALNLVVWDQGTDSAAIVTFGAPALLLALVLADYVEILLVGRLMDESEREWRSRLGAVLFMVAAAWLVFFGTTLYLPWGVQQLAGSPRAQAAVVALAGTAWGVLSALGAWAGRWLQAGKSSGWSLSGLRLLAALGPPVFLVGLFAAVSALVFILPPATVVGLSPEAAGDFLNVACDPSGCAALKWAGYFLLAVFLALLFRYSVDVNLYSLHMLYANRLIRCYLGASRRKRTWRERVFRPLGPQGPLPFWTWLFGTGGAATGADVERARIARREPTFSGFDPADDLPIRELQAVRPVLQGGVGPAEADDGYRGPYPLLNTALNLVAGTDLAWQDRKAAAFVLTPDHCGGRPSRYARVGADADANLTLGRAMTISGAAVDPNMGAYQSPPLTALMTVLNTRLGWWLQNPARWGDWSGAGPGAGVLLLQELFGQTSERSSYVHLSDGGHFENLGVYELIRRRCRFLIVSDAAEDRRAATENLANLLRLVRTDFGIRIDIDTSQLAEGPDRLTRWHCAIGLVRYDDVDPRAVAGILVYLCASLTGDESADVRQYADAHPDFPHQKTFDQFYTEAQFESYRALGFHVAQDVFGEAAALMNRDGCDPVTIQAEVRMFFARVRRRWFPSPPDAERNFVVASQLFLGVERNLRTEGRLQRLCRELYPELGEAPPPVPPPPAPRGGEEAGAEMHMVNEMLQVMEMIWFAMKLDGYHAHPLNCGWMNLFRRWSSSPTFQKYWPVLRGEYSQDFVRFCGRALNMVPAAVTSERLGSAAAVAARLGDVAVMDREFVQEWAFEADRLGWLTTGRYLRDAVEQATAFAGRPQHPREPLVWLLAVSDGPDGLPHRPCGLVCAAPPFRGAGTDLELLVWLRGPYRTLGIGRLALQTILPEIIAELGPLGQDLPAPYRLLVYYPEGGANKADRLQKAMWMNFFFDYGFRSVTTTDAGALAGVITLGREVH
jgi:hypothetical protein